MLTSPQLEKLLERKFASFFTDPSDPNIQRWLRTAKSSVEEKGEYYFRFIEKFQDIRGKRVLDAGCGDGSIAIRMAQMGAQVIGLDADQGFIEIAQTRAALYGDLPVQFIHADVCALAKPDFGQFDIILSIDVIEHVSSPRQYLTSLRRQIVREGKLFLFTANKLAPSNLKRDPHYGLGGVVLLPSPLARCYVTKFRKQVKQFDVYTMFSPWQLQRTVRGAGFKIHDLGELDFDAFAQRSLQKQIFRAPIVLHILKAMYMCRASTLKLLAEPI